MEAFRNIQRLRTKAMSKGGQEAQMGKSSISKSVKEQPERLSNKGSRNESQKEVKMKLDQYKIQLEQYQSALDKVSILNIWKSFRESEGKKDEGYIKKDQFRLVMTETFKKIVNQWSKDTTNDIFELIFERFNYKKSDSIDIYDFLVSMAICSRMSNEDKLRRTS